METNNVQVGVHVIINLYDVDASLLKDMETGTILSDKITTLLQLHVLAKSGHQFQPHGYTLLYLLSESHYSIHTYPEFRSCYVDIFCCNKDFTPTNAVDIIGTLFSTKNIKYHVISR